ncbi:MAG: GAF domain-containing protein [Armatimonadetes bacterium]|nr:GAF domain-containing protein [Armatimonadota bacterium]
MPIPSFFGSKTETPSASELSRRLEQKETELSDAKNRIRQLETALDSRAAEAASLRRIGEATGQVVNADEILPLIAEIAVEVTATSGAQVYLFNENRDHLVLRAATDDFAQELLGKVKCKIGEGITGWVAREKTHVAIASEAFADDRFKFVPELREDRYQSILSVPLIWRGECIGVINVRTLAPHEYTKQQVQLLSSIASQVAGSVAATRRIREANKRATHLSTVAEVSKTITSNLYLEEILQLAVAATAQTMNFKIVSLLLVDEEKQELVLKATQAQSRDYVKKPNLPMGESVAGQAIASGRVVTVRDVKTAPEYRFPEIAKREGLTSLACVPLKVRERVIGVMNCYTERLHDFSEDEIAVLNTLGNQVAVAIENAKLMVKGALLQEMHHRVKNNLQTIASLLRLQSHYVTNQSPKEVLNESINRVLAVAAVHDLLSREDLDTISVRKIADSILTAIKQSFVDPNKRIEMHVEGPDFMLGSHKANSVALILNEAVSNAVEHGFKIADEGVITVRLSELPEGRWRIAVRNNGDPLPDPFDIRKRTDLGLQIIDTLTRGDLQGDFTLQTEDGFTVAALNFPQ